MNRVLMAALAAGIAVVGVSSAQASEGCGPGGHRGPYGHCRPNRGGPVAVVPGGLVVGQFYNGRGYWDGRRYWQRRERWHDGWRYR
jgi:hypothetical protein